MNPFEEALAHLPHGREFRFVDRLVELRGGTAAVAEYKVRGDEPFLAGHFPGQPMMPGVILVEALAQVAGVAAQSHPSIPPLPALKLTAIRQAKILGSALPGEILRIEAEVAARLGQLIQAHGRILVEGREILQAQITLAGG